MSTSPPIPLLELFDLERIPSSLTNWLLILYFPIGLILFLFRCFVGVHAFFVACLLRKSTALRAVVLRFMCAVLGIVVRQQGNRALDVKIMCANHVSVLDHLAIDLVEPCILPSVWDIPSLVRWCFGYADLGARSGRAELVRQAKEHVKMDPMPLLALPEGAVTSGRRALLKFSTWAMEVSSTVQPVSLSTWRPLDVRSSHLSASWYGDLFWFLALPVTIVNVKWLPVVQRTEEEPVDDFAKRVSSSIATDLGIGTTNLTSQDATEAAKRHLQRTAAARPVRRRALDPRKMDEVAMRIKQSHPSVPLLAIRLDLDKTRDQMETIERIKSGQLSRSSLSGKGEKSPGGSGGWKKMYNVRKWEMIEVNRAKYLGRTKSNLAAAGDVEEKASS